MTTITKRKKLSFLPLPVLLLLLSLVVQAQDVKIDLGPSKVAENEQFYITITSYSSKLNNDGDFPDIEGFRKVPGTSTSSSTNIVNGQISTSRSVTQYYVPDRQGSFTLPPFQMIINDKAVRSEGTTITVGPPKQRNANRNSPFNSPFFDSDPFDIFNRNQKQEFVDVKADAFLALTTDKEEVYQGEGFTTTLAFYEADDNQAVLQFYELNKQLLDILKEIKPGNCWTEDFNIERIVGKPVTINGKIYTQYKIYEATFFPLNKQNINFPSFGLNMIKYKIARQPSFFGRNKKEDFKTFTTEPKTIRVKPLPPHPMSEVVSVGNYQLQEAINASRLQTGQSFEYRFKIVGEGNIEYINKPKIPDTDDFDIYAPSVMQNILRRNSQVKGAKSFEYYTVPNEPGTYNMGDFFQWVFFNPEVEAYDTLKSEIVVDVQGESRKNEYISSSDLGSFYDQFQGADNSLRSIGGSQIQLLIANLVILVLLVLTAIVIFKK